MLLSGLHCLGGSWQWIQHWQCAVCSAASEDLILRPILQVAVRGKLPILLNVARWSITFQDLSKIHQLAGRSLSRGGITSKHNSLYTPLSSVRGPQGMRRGKRRYCRQYFFISSPPLRKFWQQEHNGWSHDKKAFGCLHAEIFQGWLPSPRYSHIVKRLSISPSSSTTFIGHGNFFPGVDGSGWTCQPSSWCLTVRQSSCLACCAGQ